MKQVSSVITLVALLMFVNQNLQAQGKWYYNASFQTVGSSFDDGSTHNSFFLFNGITYQSSVVYLNVNIPMVASSFNTFTQIENTFVPNNRMGGHNNEWFNTQNHMFSSDGTITDAPSFGLGDMYINGSIQVIDEHHFLPSLSFDGYVKIPTASENLGIGTGYFDYHIALGARKYNGNFIFYAQLGYLLIGKNSGSGLTDPVTFSAGIGYTLTNKRHSFFLGYDSYSTIIQGTASPKQLGFGYNYLVRNGLFFTTIISAGLNSSTSDYTAALGFNLEI